MATNGPPPLRAACSDAGFVTLPIEVLLEVVPYTDVVSAVQMTQVSDFIVDLGCRSQDRRSLVSTAVGFLDLQGPLYAARKLLFLIIAVGYPQVFSAHSQACGANHPRRYTPGSDNRL